jgi:DNA-binding XRE family transcriptional regulator
MRSLGDIISALPDERRAKVTARGKRLIAEEKALRQLRQAREYTQANMANLLKIDQAGVSKIEKRSDMLISTMRSYVEAMGGRFLLIAEFGDGQTVEIKTFGEVQDTEPDVKPARKPKRKLNLVKPAGSACPT